MDLRRLTLHQLRVFRAVARHSSFTRAGEELGLTQPAVSAQMRSLTEILGVPLVEHLGKRVFLTDAGRALLDRVERIEAEVAELGVAFEALRDGRRGSVRVGASTSIGTYFLPGLIARFTARHPGIDVTLEIENSAHILEGLLRNAFDVAYVGEAVAAAELVAEPFQEDEIFFACAPGHPLASPALSTRQRSGETGGAPGPGTAKKGVTLEEIWRYRVFVREPGSATRRTVEAYCLGRGLPCPEGVQLGSVEAIKRSVIAGLGVSYFSELTVRDELARGELVRLAVEGFRVRRTFFEVRLRAKRPSPALERFLRFTRAYRAKG